MKKLTALLASAATLVLMSLAGCAGENTYAVDAGSSDFVIVCFNADAQTTGNGLGKQPNDATHPFTGQPGEKMTVVVKGIGGFTGPVQLSVGEETGVVTGTQPNPAVANLTTSNFVDSEFSYQIITAKPKKTEPGQNFTGTMFLTATGGGKTHKYHVYIQQADFKITVYNADKNTIGNGQGKTPNSNSNPFTGNPDDPLTIVVEPIGGFSGTVTLDSGLGTIPVEPTTPNPTSVTITPSTFQDSEFSWVFNNGGRPKRGARGIQLPTTTVTATSGNIVHTYTVFFQPPQ